MSPESQPSCPAPKRSPRADGLRNREALIAAAKRLFDEHGPDVPLDEIAKAAEVANATLYRHFATRADLIVAVYAEEVIELDTLSDRLLRHGDPGQALDDWLHAFVRHVATKRDLAMAIPDEPENQRGTRFSDWHATMLTAATRLLDRAKDTKAARQGLSATDLLALASGIAVIGVPAARLDTLLAIMRDGYRVPDEGQPTGIPPHSG